MVNWTVTPYLTFAEAQTAQQAIANDIYSEIIPFMEAGRQKFALVSPGVKLPVDVGDIAVTIEGGTFSSDIDKVGGFDIDTGAGDASTGSARIVIATDDLNVAAIKAKTDNIPALGQALAAASTPIVLTAAQLTTLTPPAAITNFANETGGNLAAIKAKTDNLPELGQALAAACIPVVLPAADITTLTPPAAITNFANETGGNLASIKAKTDNIPAQGQALAAASLPVVIPAAQTTDLKSVLLTDNPLTTDYKLRVGAVPYGYDVAHGLITGHTQFFKTGFNGDVDAAEEDMWCAGGVYVFPTAEMRMEVVSTSINDTSATGSGVRTVKIWYLTSAHVEKTETISLLGTTVVPTAADDIYRINAFRVMTAGGTGAAEGTISIRHLANTPIYSQIAIGNTRARNSIYTVPTGKTLYITQLAFSCGHSQGGRYCRFTLRATYDDLIGAPSTIFYPYYEIGVQDGAYTVCLDVPLKFIATTDVKISVIGDAGNADAICTAAYRGWLE